MIMAIRKTAAKKTTTTKKSTASKKTTASKTLKAAPKKSTGSKPAQAAPKRTASSKTARPVSKKPSRKPAPGKSEEMELGSGYECSICGLAVSVDKVCGCIDTCDIVCCGEPMQKV
jgi:hypothetical protein